MNARALHESDVDPMDAARLAEDPDGVADGSRAVLVTLLAAGLAVFVTAVSIVMMMRRRRSHASAAVALLPRRAVDSLQHAVSRLSDVAAG